ncbi:MAG: peptidase [Sandaracinaceae bacterium]|nr:peptidase [Sandaracinaceae bacterium]
MRLRLVLVGLLCMSASARADVEPGDVVFQRSRSRQAQVIAEVTRSEWTHVGVVLERRGERVVLEAVSPVRWTPFETWRRRGVGGRVLVRRPRAPLDTDALRRMSALGDAWVGRPYDARFEWGEARLYCSELVFLLFERGAGVRLVEPQRWADLSLGPRARRLARQRLGRLPDPDGLLVTPAALATSDALRTIE